MAKIIADAYAWIELFAGTPSGETAKAKMEQADALVTPDTVLAEVARKYLREGVEEWIIRRRLSTIMEASEPAYVDDEIAVEAAKAYAQLRQKAKEEGLDKPSLFDALVLAVARRNDGKVLTGDEHFRNLPETLWMGS